MLTIKDLSASKELDRAAMTTVRGGFGVGDVLNSLNDYRIDSDFYVDASTKYDVTNQLNLGSITNVAGPGSVSIPMFAQSNSKA